ncbi:DNA-processing protein DprA [Sphingobacterium sp. HJSM2_6]|uniref:DNA-processing protein DprA n=1 Tax=Sphingobacterium sp. HJSM2_6 TaxID=3366264 RepID=UPI003BE26858
MNAIEKIAITKIKGIGPKSSRLLLAYFGSLENIFLSNKKELQQIPGLSANVIQQLLNKSFLAESEQELRFVEDQQIQLLWFEDELFPQRLKQCDDSPMLLYHKGTINLNQPKVISVVGTRNATSYGKKLTEQLLNELKEFQVLVVSGLAFGIDIQAHRTALQLKLPTTAVLGHSLDRIYPYEHSETAKEIMQAGSLLTEFPSGTLPDRMNFPMRNRIIAGLADVTIVVEAANKGGALITAEIANSYDRDVCAYPGHVDQPYSAGCNYLIKTNKAHLIQEPQDLINLMQWKKNNQQKQNIGFQLPLMPSLSTDEKLVFDFLKDENQASIDDIAYYCKWPASKLAVTLLEMEMTGLIQTLPGKIYKLP